MLACSHILCFKSDMENVDNAERLPGFCHHCQDVPIYIYSVREHDTYIHSHIHLYIYTHTVPVFLCLC